ncbi:VOC family protein [Tahibacter amnicola]|uniref:VOC family protein n=1 Tax=Tahibacter amnicola TaxID=2976241 RepID=A0ABY6BDA0_9GAMM|nr:VOC family protein [Tahibacter amnicola]UXI65892.1 VOC family protein [Tahibacter amnicola]
MSIDAVDLGAGAKSVAFVYVSDRERALGFYRDTLGFAVHSSDNYGDYLSIPGSLLRLTVIPDMKPHPHPVVGFEVSDVVSVVKAFRERGVVMDTFEGMDQDDLGIWHAPDGRSKLAFFKDADGNALMLTQA